MSLIEYNFFVEYGGFVCMGILSILLLWGFVLEVKEVGKKSEQKGEKSELSDSKNDSTKTSNQQRRQKPQKQFPLPPPIFYGGWS